jgi:hypothetical protein
MLGQAPAAVRDFRFDFLGSEELLLDHRFREAAETRRRERLVEVEQETALHEVRQATRPFMAKRIADEPQREIRTRKAFVIVGSWRSR